VLSVSPDPVANLPSRAEAPRMSGADEGASGSGFASLIETPADNPPVDRAPARADTASASDHRRQQDEASASGNTPARTATDAATSGHQAHATGPTHKVAPEQAKLQNEPGEKSDAGDASTDTVDVGGSAVVPASDIAASTIVPTVAVTTAQASSPPPTPTPSNPATAGPLAIASAAIAASTRDIADPSPAPTMAGAAVADSSATLNPVADAVTDAANEIAETNFEIAKAVTTPPAPGTKLTPEASAALQAQAQAATAVAAQPALPKPTLKSEVIENAVAAVAAKGEKADRKTDIPPAPPQQQPDTEPATKTQDASASLPAADSKRTKSDTADDARMPVTPAKDSAPDQRAANLGSSTHGTSDAMPQPATAVQQQAVPLTATATPPAQLGAAVATGIAVPLNGLAVQIAANAQNGRSRFEIRLDPAELGRIDVRLDVDRHGHVTSHLVVERAETLAMLRQDAPQLQRALEDAGLKTGSNGLQFSLRDQSGNNGGDDHSGRNMHRLIVADADSLPAVAAGRSYGSAANSMRGLDIRV
jgi:hypothetical protein